MNILTLRQNLNKTEYYTVIIGYSVNNQRHFKLSQYTDDGTLILSNIKSINYSLPGITTFSKLSGLN